MTRYLLGLLAAAALLASGGCGKVSTAEAVRFNDAMVDSNKRVVDAAKSFGVAAGAAVDGGIEAVAKARREFEKMEEALQRARSEMRTLQVPPSPTAKAFYDEHDKLLAHQEKMVTEEFKLIVRVLDDPNLSAADRRKKILPIARYVQSMDQGSIAGIKQAQAAFANAHGFKIK